MSRINIPGDVMKRGVGLESVRRILTSVKMEKGYKLYKGDKVSWTVGELIGELGKWPKDAVVLVDMLDDGDLMSLYVEYIPEEGVMRIIPLEIPHRVRANKLP